MDDLLDKEPPTKQKLWLEKLLIQFLKIIRIILVTISVVCFLLWFINRYVLSYWYTFELNNYKIVVYSDECETCFLDWPFDHTIWVRDLNSGQSSKIDFYTEGPRLEFGFNKTKDELLINCPGFEARVLDLNRFSSLGKLIPEVSESWQIMDEFTINCAINRQRKKEYYEKGKRPDRSWD